eukprot:gnl/Hemi2/12561_TR4291_c0_g1_i1.p2 gnl/Hemi2/12561_TR4291_c0_g1~~gnl/Hemi2/12561_TR4291_c0_g1_i1.p2  ORF type:complete len:133 (-),score=37.69 gnl/Hemi2/12561_TR4291_c0_g1_i1:190-588(-)
MDLHDQPIRWRRLVALLAEDRPDRPAYLHSGLVVDDVKELIGLSLRELERLRADVRRRAALTHAPPHYLDSAEAFFRWLCTSLTRVILREKLHQRAPAVLLACDDPAFSADAVPADVAAAFASLALPGLDAE